MKIIIVILNCFILLSFNADNSKKDLISKLLIGKWVHEQDDDNTSFRYIKSIEHKKNKRGFIFHQSGRVTIYEEFGCQMPPNFRSVETNWEVKSNSIVFIEEHNRTRRMKIIEMNDKILRFKWKKDKSHKRH